MMRDGQKIKTEVVRGLFIFGMISLAVLWFVLLVRNPEGMQRSLFFHDRNDWFMDFYNTVYYTVNRTPYTWGALENRNYFPLVYMTLWPFTQLLPYDTEDMGTSYMARYTQLGGIFGGIYLVASFGVLFYVLYRSIKGKEWERVGILFAMFVSGVTIYNFDRGNLLVFSTGLLFYYFYTLDSSSKIVRQSGLLALALSAVYKIFPCVFGILLLHRKRYKDAVLAILYGVLLAFVPFVLLKGNLGENLYGFWQSLMAHEEAYSGGVIGFSSATILNLPNPFPQWGG